MCAQARRRTPYIPSLLFVLPFWRGILIYLNSMSSVVSCLFCALISFSSSGLLVSLCKERDKNSIEHYRFQFMHTSFAYFFVFYDFMHMHKWMMSSRDCEHNIMMMNNNMQIFVSIFRLLAFLHIDVILTVTLFLRLFN